MSTAELAYAVFDGCLGNEHVAGNGPHGHLDARRMHSSLLDDLVNQGVAEAFGGGVGLRSCRRTKGLFSGSRTVRLVRGVAAPGLLLVRHPHSGENQRGESSSSCRAKPTRRA
jgi:hypothetical protein